MTALFWNAIHSGCCFMIMLLFSQHYAFPLISYNQLEWRMIGNLIWYFTIPRRFHLLPTMLSLFKLVKLALLSMHVCEQCTLKLLHLFFLIKELHTRLWLVLTAFSWILKESFYSKYAIRKTIVKADILIFQIIRCWQFNWNSANRWQQLEITKSYF